MIEKAARDFAMKISAVPAVAAFRAASERLSADEEAKRLLSELQERQNALVRKAQAGMDPSQAEIDSLRQLQKEVFRNPVLREYFRSQQLAQAFWPQVSDELSQALGADFNALARLGG